MFTDILNFCTSHYWYGVLITFSVILLLLGFFSEELDVVWMGMAFCIGLTWFMWAPILAFIVPFGLVSYLIWLFGQGLGWIYNKFIGKE